RRPSARPRSTSSSSRASPRADDLLAQVACAPPGGAVRQSLASLRLDLRGPRRGSGGGLALLRGVSDGQDADGAGRDGSGESRSDLFWAEPTDIIFWVAMVILAVVALARILRLIRRLRR